EHLYRQEYDTPQPLMNYHQHHHQRQQFIPMPYPDYPVIIPPDIAYLPYPIPAIQQQQQQQQQQQPQKQQQQSGNGGSGSFQDNQQHQQALQTAIANLMAR